MLWLLTDILIISIVLFMTDFDLVLHDWLLMKIAASGMELRVVVWFIRRESESENNYQRKLRVLSGVLQGSILDPLLFPAYINHIWKNTESTFRLFMEDCVIYRKIVSNSDIEKLQICASWVIGRWKIWWK